MASYSSSDQNKDFIFAVDDPRGYKVVCTKECWQKHILYEHPEMSSELQAIIDTIRNPIPLVIYQDKDFVERNIFYAMHSSIRSYLKVVVEYKESGLGEVITAFFADSPKPGERLLWIGSRD